MPAKKPLSLIEKHLTKIEREARLYRESGLSPITQLSDEIPQSLEGKRYEYAAHVWERSINLYAELQGVIATALDEDLLIKYCKAEQHFKEMEDFRSEKINQLAEAKAKAAEIKLTAEAEQIKEWRSMWGVVNEMEKIVTLLDARLDAKGKYIHTLQQSLYLTPRSRSGVAPARKEKPEADPFGDGFD